MRVLLVNGSDPAGGSFMSTMAFARALVAGGHDVVSLVRSFDHPRRDLVHEQLEDASIKAPGVLGDAIVAVDRLLGRRARPVPGHGHPVWGTPYPEHAMARLLRLFEPDVVVGNSIDRVSWRRCTAFIRAAGARTALHLREANAIGHLVISDEVPDVLLGNAQSLVDSAAEVGRKAFLVPSVVEVAACAVESTRRVALFVHPVPEFGLEVVLRLAVARPDVPFVLQESRPLGDGLTTLRRRVETLPNVEVRGRRPPESLFSDVRVLLVPHRTDGWSNRPRVVLEAQHNGIPVIATDFAGLREAVGAGGLLIPVDAPDDQWLEAFDSAWTDPSGTLERRARAHAARPEVQPATVVAAFESAMSSIGLVPELPSTAPDETVDLSVVIPAHNAQETLNEQLDAVLAQDWPPGFEVIVVDNHSTDATARLVRDRMSTDERLRLVTAADGDSAAYARNAGVAAARGKSVAFCDADDVVAEGWLEAMGKALGDHELVAGRVNVQALNPSGLARSRGLAIADGPGRFGPVPFAHGCNIGVRRQLLEAVGGWDPSVRTGEDIELCLRLWRRGLELYYEPSAEIFYRYRDDGPAHWRQALRYGTAHVDLARRLEVRQLDPPSRLRGLRNLAWLARHGADVLDPTRRPHWVWTGGVSAGHIKGSVRWRTTYL